MRNNRDTTRFTGHLTLRTISTECADYGFKKGSVVVALTLEAHVEGEHVLVWRLRRLNALLQGVA